MLGIEPLGERQVCYLCAMQPRLQTSCCNAFKTHLCALFRQGVLLHEEGHHVSARQELHDQVEVDGVLKRVVHLHDPLVVGLH